MSITLHAELEQLTKLGEVSDPKEVPPCDPFTSQSPYPVDPALFFEAAEVADALVAGSEIGEEIIDFSKPILRPTEEDEEEHGEEPCDDPHCVCHQDCEINECQTCLEKWIDDGEREADAARDREMFG